MKSLFISFACIFWVVNLFFLLLVSGQNTYTCTPHPGENRGVAFALVLRSLPFVRGPGTLPGWGAENDTADGSQLSPSSAAAPRRRKTFCLRLSLTGSIATIQCLLYVWTPYYSANSSEGPSLFLCCQSVQGRPQWHLHGGSAASSQQSLLPHPHQPSCLHASSWDFLSIWPASEMTPGMLYEMQIFPQISICLLTLHMYFNLSGTFPYVPWLYLIVHIALSEQESRQHVCECPSFLTAPLFQRVPGYSCLIFQMNGTVSLPDSKPCYIFYWDHIKFLS